MTLSFQASLFDGLDSGFDSGLDSGLDDGGLGGLHVGGPGRGLGPLEGHVERIDLGDGAWLDLRPGWVTQSDALFESLVDRVPWHADRREMYDRVVDVPRLVSWFGPEAELPDPALHVAQETLNDHYGRPPQQVFETAGLCFYRTGDDSIAWHGDKVGEAIDRDTMVAIVSVGAARSLAVRSRSTGEVRRFPLGHGDLLVMGGSCQRTQEHSIAKTKRAVGPRISIQFRPVWSRQA